MLDPSALRTMRVMIATPCAASAVSMHYAASIFGLSREATSYGLPLILHFHSECLITRARNRIVAAFLENENLTHLFWVDSDIAFAPASFFRLLLADRSVAAALYPSKTETWPEGGLPPLTDRAQLDARTLVYPLFPLARSDESEESVIDGDGFIEVFQAPAGFMVVQRETLVRMAKSNPELAYSPDGGRKSPLTTGHHWRFFDCMVDEHTREYVSEDYAFCRRWRRSGGRIFVDVNSNLGHAGQHLLQGDLVRGLQASGRL